MTRRTVAKLSWRRFVDSFLGSHLREAMVLTKQEAIVVVRASQWGDAPRSDQYQAPFELLMRTFAHPS